MSKYFFVKTLQSFGVANGSAPAFPSSGIHPSSSGGTPPYLLSIGFNESSINTWGIPIGLHIPLAKHVLQTTSYLKGSTSGYRYLSFSGSFLL